MAIPYANHGAGIFTYKTGWFVFGQVLGFISQHHFLCIWQWQGTTSRFLWKSSTRCLWCLGCWSHVNRLAIIILDGHTFIMYTCLNTCVTCVTKVCTCMYAAAYILRIFTHIRDVLCWSKNCWRVHQFPWQRPSEHRPHQSLSGPDSELWQARRGMLGSPGSMGKPRTCCWAAVCCGISDEV